MNNSGVMDKICYIFPIIAGKVRLFFIIKKLFGKLFILF